jgi:hypothetical protein
MQAAETNPRGGQYFQSMPRARMGRTRAAHPSLLSGPQAVPNARGQLVLSQNGVRLLPFSAALWQWDGVLRQTDETGQTKILVSQESIVPGKLVLLKSAEKENKAADLPEEKRHAAPREIREATRLSTFTRLFRHTAGPSTSLDSIRREV